MEKMVDKINKEYDFDSPNAIDFEMLTNGLSLLKKRKSFRYQTITNF